MRTRVDPTLREEALRFGLRYACDHCAHFDEDRGGCAEGYPNTMHRDDRVESVATLEFCKSFELL
jgi:hypothetical protein